MIAPSPFIETWLAKIKPAGSVLDVACGKGRHALACLDAGFQVTAVDKTPGPFGQNPDLEIITADLEGAPWPLGTRQFDAVVVSNYLWRPLFGFLDAAVKPGGLLLYETFGVGNERYGKPSNPDFLLRPGELSAAFGKAFEVLLNEHGDEAIAGNGSKRAVRQRLAARKKP